MNQFQAERMELWAAKRHPFVGWGQKVEFYLVRLGEHPARCKEIVMEAITPENDGVAPVPSFVMGLEECQKLMDELWQCGLRPSEGTGSAGSLAATERHLKDMQRLVFERAARSAADYVLDAGGKLG